MKIVNKKAVVDTGNMWRVLSPEDNKYVISFGVYSKSKPNRSGPLWGPVAVSLVLTFLIGAAALTSPGMPKAIIFIVPLVGILSLLYVTGVAEKFAYNSSSRGIEALQDTVDITYTYSRYEKRFTDKINDMLSSGGSLLDMMVFSSVAEEDGLETSRPKMIENEINSGGHVADIVDDLKE